MKYRIRNPRGCHNKPLQSTRSRYYTVKAIYLVNPRDAIIHKIYDYIEMVDEISH